MEWIHFNVDAARVSQFIDSCLNLHDAAPECILHKGVITPITLSPAAPYEAVRLSIQGQARSPSSLLLSITGLPSRLHVSACI